jgi:toxin ParE1/3/4
VNISFFQSAIEDLENILEYYLEQVVPQIERDFVTAIVKHVTSLSAHPDIGRVVPEFNDELIRELIHAPFRIVYLRERKSVNIIRVWRSERLLNLPKQS